MVVDQSYVERALAAYWREASRTGQQVRQPGHSDSEERTYQGKRYVVLENSYDVLAVYRIKPDGLLRRLKRWPSGLIDGDYVGVERHA